ncbi:hypothetical protein Tco_0308880 [Tanacetum coccineum]
METMLYLLHRHCSLPPKENCCSLPPEETSCSLPSKETAAPYLLRRMLLLTSRGDYCFLSLKETLLLRFHQRSSFELDWRYPVRRGSFGSTGCGSLFRSESYFLDRSTLVQSELGSIRDAIEVNLRRLLELGKRDLSVDEYLSQLGFSIAYSFLRVIPRTMVYYKDCTFISSPGCSRPNMSFDMPAYPEYLSSLARASLVEVSSLSSFPYFPAMSKNDIKTRVSTILKDDLRDLVKTFCIPANLHPRLLDPALTMDRLPDDPIGPYVTIGPFGVIRCSKRKLMILGDAKIVEELHHLPVPLLDRVPQYTTAPAAEGALIPVPTLDKVAAAQSDPCLIKTSNDLCKGKVDGLDDASDFWVNLENSLERTDSIPARVVSAPMSYLGKRLGPPPSSSFLAVPEPLQIGGSVRTSTSEHDFAQKVFAHSLSCSATGGFAGKAEDVRRWLDPLDTLARSALAYDSEYDQIPEDDFVTASHGEEIDLTYFPLALCPYAIPYPFDGNPSPPYSRALDHTITLAELRRMESLLPLELVNRVNVLSALLVLHDMELNNRYSNLVNRKENELALERSKSQEYKDVAEGLRTKVTRFVGSGIECLVRRLLSSNKFNAALAHVMSLGIAFGVEKGLRMGRTDTEFEVAARNVSNFSIGAEAEFNKALDAFPSIQFPFLCKVTSAAKGP